MLQLSCDERRFCSSCVSSAAQWRCWFSSGQDFWQQQKPRGGRESCRACGQVGPRTWTSLDFVSCRGSSFGCCSCCCSCFCFCCFDSSSSFLHPDQFRRCCCDGHDGAAECLLRQKASCLRPPSGRSDPWPPRRWGWG
jgi:hypothetical protein